MALVASLTEIGMMQAISGLAALAVGLASFNTSAAVKPHLLCTAENGTMLVGTIGAISGQGLGRNALVLADESDVRADRGRVFQGQNGRILAGSAHYLN